jgi:hypothetical protein
MKVSTNVSGRMGFPITIHFNSGDQHLTLDAARELSEKLIEAISWVKPDGAKNTEQANQPDSQ